MSQVSLKPNHVASLPIDLPHKKLLRSEVQKVVLLDQVFVCLKGNRSFRPC